MNDKTKRYHLVLPKEIFEQIQAIADENHTSILEVIKKFVKLGFIAYELPKTGKRLIVEDENGQREIVLFKDEAE